jgi:uncharacterized membrane protein YeaQ/YmgE (transglycosylase-associated protein family)
MTLPALLIAVVMGLVVGGLAGLVMRDGSYGMMGDVLLGVAGSSVGAWLFHLLAMDPDPGWFATIGVTLVGAISLIAAERRLWPLHREGLT